MIFEQIATGGCQSYLVGCADKCAAVLIDPEIRQVNRYLALAAAVAGVATAALEVTLRARSPLVVLAACTPAFAAVYAFAIAGLKIVKPDDLQRLSAVFTRLRG